MLSTSYTLIKNEKIYKLEVDAKFLKKPKTTNQLPLWPGEEKDGAVHQW